MILQLYLTLAAVVVVGSAYAASVTLPVKCVRTLCETSYVGVNWCKCPTESCVCCAVLHRWRLFVLWRQDCLPDRRLSATVLWRRECLPDWRLSVTVLWCQDCLPDWRLSATMLWRRDCLPDWRLSVTVLWRRDCLPDWRLSVLWRRDCLLDWRLSVLWRRDCLPDWRLSVLWRRDCLPDWRLSVLCRDCLPDRRLSVSWCQDCLPDRRRINVPWLCRNCISDNWRWYTSAHTCDHVRWWIWWRGRGYGRTKLQTSREATRAGKYQICGSQRQLGAPLTNMGELLYPCRHRECRTSNTKSWVYQTLGPDTLRIWNGLGLKSEDTVDEIIKRIDEYCIGEVHEVMEQFNFNNRDQRPGESVNDYIAALRTLAKTCNFNGIKTNEVESTMIRNRIIQGIGNKPAQAKMLDKRNASLNDVIDIARMVETTEQSQKLLFHASNPIHAMTDRSKNPRDQTRFKKKTRPSGKNNASARCMFCEKNYVFVKEQCPAWGKTCMGCKGKNHFKGSRKCPMHKG